MKRPCASLQTRIGWRNRPQVREHLREKLTVVYEGAEIPSRFTEGQRSAARSRWGISGDTPLLGCVGVLLADKGQEWLIRVSRRTPERAFPDAKLLLAGDGQCREKLESLAEELGVGEAVLFPGFVKDVETVYAALDVFLLPSFFEALNNSLLAAMAYEIPSIAFNRGALGEIIEQGKNGLLVSGPDVAEICKAVRDSSKTANFQRAWGKRDAKEWKRTFPRHTWWTECYASTKKSWEAQRKLNHAHRGSAA